MRVEFPKQHETDLSYYERFIEFLKSINYGGVVYSKGFTGTLYYDSK